jgi:prepilin-type N-terminal cleavage/methylation domain-containing protein
MTRSKGFTLAELAVAVVILALLLFGAMVPFSSQLEIRNIAETRRILDSTRDAIVGFAQANGRLPCPANGNVAAGSANAGVEQFNGTTCVAALGGGVLGVVPWVTLGTAETDAWGHRLTYRVSPAFADAVALTSWNTRLNAYTPPAGYLAQVTSNPTSPANQTPQCDLKIVPTQSSFSLCTLGDIAVFTRTVSSSAPLASAVPALFISHGKNGRGAWQPNGIQLSVPAGTDEAANVNGGMPNWTPTGGYLSFAFYSRNPTPATPGCVDPTPPGTANAAALCEFDDIVVTISSSALVARMVAAGRLP